LCHYAKCTENDMDDVTTMLDANVKAGGFVQAESS
jgi:hypothetical protein